MIHSTIHNHSPGEMTPNGLGESPSPAQQKKGCWQIPRQKCSISTSGRESWGSWLLFLWLSSRCRTSRVFPGARCLLVQGVRAEGVTYWPNSCWGAVGRGLGGGGKSVQKGTTNSPVFSVSLQTSPTVISLRRRRRREMVSTAMEPGSCAQDALESKLLEPVALAVLVVEHHLLCVLALGMQQCGPPGRGHCPSLLPAKHGGPFSAEGFLGGCGGSGKGLERETRSSVCSSGLQSFPGSSAEAEEGRGWRKGLYP